MAKNKPQPKPQRKRRTRSEQRTRRRNFMRRFLSLILLLLCMFPMLGGGLQPLWVLPAAICISMNEDIYFCMAAGVLAGLALDLANGSTLGSNALFTVIACTAVCLLFEQFLRRSFWHYMVLNTVLIFLYSFLRYAVTVGVLHTPGREQVWQHILLPAALLTLPAAVIVYLLYLPLTRLLTKRVRSMDAAAIRRDW